MPPEDPKAPRSIKEWITTFLDNDEEDFYSQFHNYGSETDPNDPNSGHDSSGHDSSGRNQDSGSSGTYYDDIDVDFEDGVLESLIILGLAATLVVLVYVRQQRALRRGAQQQQQQGQQQQPGAGGLGNANVNANANGNNNAGDNDRGLFPRPGEPDFAQWAAGAVGH